MPRVLVILATFAATALMPCIAHSAESMPSFIRTESGFLMVLKQGDDVLESLRQLAKRERIHGASFTGMGYARTATFGVYDFKTESYLPRTFDSVSVASLTGTLAWQQDEPSIHAHAVVVNGEEFQASGGHLLDLMVGAGSMEITIVVHDKTLEKDLQRRKDADLGVDVLELPQ